jgi:tetratricopeptide (TPR) repeat protein
LVRERFLIIFFALIVFPLAGVDFSVRVRPYISFPFGSGMDLFTPGGGVDAVFDVDISSILSNPFYLGYSLGPEVGMGFVPLKAAGSVMSILSGGIQASLFYYPLSRLNLRAGGSMGIYQGSREGTTSPVNLWVKFSGEAGFRFSPGFILSAHAGYQQNNYRKDEPLYRSIFAGITAQIQFESGTNDNRITVGLNQTDDVFPIFLNLYRNSPVGFLTITNHESAEIRNVKVSFRAGSYTSSEYPCGTIPILGKGRSAQVPLRADFSAMLMSFSENGRIPGEVLITYELLGASRGVQGTVVVEILNRNSFRWSDPASLAVFISASDPAVLDFQKYIIGMARNRRRTGLNERMQNAAFLFEGLRGSGIQYSEDKETPYTAFHTDSENIDSIQFPFQTLAYRSGDIDDIGLLYAASLEAAGIPAALIPLENDFLVAYSLGISEAAAVNYFENMDNLLVINDEVWMPLAFSNFREGFINSWYQAINELNYTFNGGGDIDFIILEEAWADYSPVVLPAQNLQADKPLEETVTRLVETDMMRYISTEFSPKIQRLFDEIKTQGGTASRFNQLGLLYVRAGMTEQANIEYQRAVALGSVAAMVNLGNLALLGRNYADAERWYTQALRLEPGNRIALNGLNQITESRED